MKYKFGKPTTTSIKAGTTYDGETIEEKMARIINNKEPIADGAPLIFTDRKDGVQPEYNIKTDRWEVAVEAKDLTQKHYIAKRQQSIGERTYDTMTPEQQKQFNKDFPKNKHNKPTNPNNQAT